MSKQPTNMPAGSLNAPTIAALPLKSRLASANITLIVAGASYGIWWQYVNIETRDLKALNRYPNFFQYDCEAHFRNMVVSLHTLYDNYKGTLTIKSLIHDLAPEVAKPIWKRYKNQEIHAAASKIAFLRHNVIAHRDPTKSYSDIYREAGLKLNDFKSLIANSHFLLSMIADATGFNGPNLPEFVEDETAMLLAKIK